VPEEPQDERLVSYAPRLRKEEGRVDWNRPARAVHNHIRGLHPWPHAFTGGPRGRLILHRSAVVAETGEVRVEPGTILVAGGDQLQVATGPGVLALLELQAEGGRVLPARAFLAGHPLAPGERLGAP
jgi:methionyl-tRNA formyltransferase